MKIIEKNLEELIPYDNNPRNNEDAVDAVAESIKEFGWQQPIVIDPDSVIVAGHTRYLAAKKLQLKTVPVVIATDLTKDQIKAYRLADNRTAELASWDYEKLNLEMMDLKAFDMQAFGFGGPDDWFHREKEGKAKQEGNDEYNAFVDKFERKKTSDDCYTPDNVYEAVAGYVSQEFGVRRDQMVRPFYPGGDYQHYQYNSDSVVVDNPPFSIMAEILRWYSEHEIKYFLFAPALTLFTRAASETSCMIPTINRITYENGANIRTSFLTNLDTVNMIRTAPELYEAVDAANKENEKGEALSKYNFPEEAVTSTQFADIARAGIDLQIPRAEAAWQNNLDDIKEKGREAFGGIILISKAKARAKAKAKAKALEDEIAKQKAEAGERGKEYTFILSERENKIVEELSKGVE